MQIQQRAITRAVIYGHESIMEMVSGPIEEFEPLETVEPYPNSEGNQEGESGEGNPQDESCADHLRKNRAQRGFSGMVCLRAPSGASQNQIDELKDHIAAINSIPGYWSPSGRVSPRGEIVVGPDGEFDLLEKVAEKIKRRHKEDVTGTPYEYVGKVAGHLPDTTWSGNQRPYCWHQQDGSVNSKVGRYSLKYNVGYRPTGFYYAGVEGAPATYTTERVSGSVSRGQYGICSITRP